MDFKPSPNPPHIRTESSVLIPPALLPQKTAEELRKENTALREEIGSVLALNKENFFRVATKILREEFKISPKQISPEAKILEDLGLKRAKLRSFLYYLGIEFNRKFTVPESGTLGGLLG
jgi:hypothetical protein